MTDVSEGDIVLFKRTGKNYGSGAVPYQEGCPLLIEHVRIVDGEPFFLEARDAFNLTRARIKPYQVQPVPADLCAEDAYRAYTVKLHGERKGPDIADRSLSQYRALVAQGEIPEVDESRVLREDTQSPRP
jgi:hypothetical protein